MTKGFKNCIQTIEKFEDDKFHYIITEFLEGNSLEFLIKNENILSEKFLQNFLSKTASFIRFLNEKDMFLEFITDKNFYFSYYNNENDFDVKFIDFGLHIIYSDINEQRNYMLLEAKKGKINNQKTNILSLGMIIFKILFKQTIYNFSSDEDPSKTISASKI